MNPDQQNYHPQDGLPKPTSQASQEARSNPVVPANAEMQSGASELPPQGGPAAPVMPPPVPVSSQPAVAPAMPSAAAMPMITEEQQEALEADDNDLIEKEWVIRAKSLVAKTKDNPHEQNKELNRFKADYVKKRYNKELKVTEG